MNTKSTLQGLLLCVVILLCGMQLHADTYRIVRLSEAPIKIGGKSLNTNATFSDNQAIEWTSDKQEMQVVNTGTGRRYTARKRVAPQSGKTSTIKDFICRTSYGSTRDINDVSGLDLSTSPVGPEFPERRAALIIGNSNYEHISPLRNAQNDAAALADELTTLGFDVMQVYEADDRAMKEALKRFAKQAEGYDFVMFYYAGHGIQEDGRNYLVPINAKLEFKSELRDCLNCDDISDYLNGIPAKGRLIVLDACRNPKKSWSRSADEGLARMEAGEGSVILFSTQSGKVAFDGEGDHSPFATALLANLADKNSFSQVLNNVVRDTYSATDKKQYPLLVGTLLNDFVFNATGVKPAGTPDRPAAGSAGMATQTPAQNSQAAQPTRPVEQPRPQASPVQYSRRAENLDIQPLSMRVSGNKCVMELAITNTSNKMVWPIIAQDGIFGESAAYDSEGNTYLFKSNVNLPDNGQLPTLPPGVTMVQRIVITDFDPSATSLPLLRIALRSTENDQAYGQDAVEMRNVPLQLRMSLPTGPRGSQNLATSTAADVDVQLKSATLSGTTATITLLFNNMSSEDLDVNFVGLEPMGSFNFESECFDPAGKYIGRQSFVAGNFKLPKGLPVKYTFKINDIPAGTTYLPYIGLAVRGFDVDTPYGAAQISLRNVMLQ